MTSLDNEAHYRRRYDARMDEIALTRERLGQIVPQVAHRKKELEDRLDTVEGLVRELSYEQYMESKKSREGREKHSFLLDWGKLQTEIREASLPRIAIADCVHGNVYVLHSRNLAIGAWHEERQGFSGIRSKFGERFVFMEHHWDYGGSFASARPTEDLGPLPDGVLPDEDLGSEEIDTGRAVRWNREAADDEHILGRRCYLDTGEACEGKTRRVSNRALFAHLEALEASRRGDS